MNERVTVTEMRLPEKYADTEPQPFFPRNRPPTALLMALDDGSTTRGETWRIRSTPHTIGRTSGATVISHDPDISAEHARIVRASEGGNHRWSLEDQKSKNGSFVRVRRVSLRHGLELLIGRRRFVFSAPESDIGAFNHAEPFEPTRTFRRAADAMAPSKLVACNPPEELEIVLPRVVTRIGSDAKRSDLVLDGDPLVSPTHAIVHLTEKGSYELQDSESLNGVWVRVDRATLDHRSQFQLGEQRFLFKTCSMEE